MSELIDNNEPFLYPSKLILNSFNHELKKIVLDKEFRIEDHNNIPVYSDPTTSRTHMICFLNGTILPTGFNQKLVGIAKLKEIKPLFLDYKQPIFEISFFDKNYVFDSEKYYLGTGSIQSDKENDTVVSINKIINLFINVLEEEPVKYIPVCNDLLKSIKLM